MYGGMIVGYGNFFRMSQPGEEFDFDEINSDGSGCVGDCKNNTVWNEFGCKTGMGKRARRPVRQLRPVRFRYLHGLRNVQLHERRTGNVVDRHGRDRIHGR